MKVWVKNNLIAVLAIFVPILIMAIIFIFKTLMVHDVEIKHNKEMIIHNKDAISINRETTNKAILHLDNKITK